MSRHGVSLAEALSMPDAFDRSQALAHMADLVDEVASKSGSTELQLWQVQRVLGASNLMELLCLRSQGFQCYRRDGVWYMDSRSFRRFATGQNFTPTAYTTAPAPQSPSLF